jgi:hypothetical protein
MILLIMSVRDVCVCLWNIYKDVLKINFCCILFTFSHIGEQNVSSITFSQLVNFLKPLLFGDHYIVSIVAARYDCMTNNSMSCLNRETNFCG